jgi:hypothetical protein
MICKHFDLQKGCSAGDKCHFAHGTHELRKQEDVKIFKISLYHLKLSHIIFTSKY